MNINKLFLLVLLVLGVCSHASSQSDSTVVESTPALKPFGSAVLDRPQLEVGTGVLSYTGDIGNLNGISTSRQSNWGFHINLRNPLTETLDLNFYTLFGHLSAAERMQTGEVNFKTDIKGGGINLLYNFHNFLPDGTDIYPYIFAGISTFEFNPKGDLRDANGVYYNYWSDGTIRSISETAFNASEAEIIKRDYTFETDLRESENNMESYALRTFTIPVGVGVKLKVNESFNMRIGTEMNFALSDNLDNVNPQNQVVRSGDTKNDRFLYSSFGISYNLNIVKKDRPEDVYDDGINTFPEEDEDNDGINDFADYCPFTPADVSVDEKGCPLDSDGDGVADYLDEEPQSAKDAIVDTKGNTLSDSDIETMYLAYIDTIGNLQYQKTRTSTKDVPSVKFGKRSKGFSVQIANVDDLSADEIAQLLSVPDISVEEINGKTYYIAGKFNKLEDAVIRKIQLQNDKFQTQVIKNEFGQISAVGQEAEKAEEEIRKQAASDPELLALFDGQDKVTFRVQIGAYRYRMAKNIFTNVPDLLVIDGNDGLTRYVSGSYGNIKDAAKHKIDLLLKGFEGAFVTAYKNGKRISLKDAGATVETKEDISKETNGGKINKELIKFSIQLGEFTGRIPANVLSEYLSIGNVRPMRGTNGVTRYVSGSYDTQAEASAELQRLKVKGYPDAFLVGDFNGQIIDAEEAQKMLDQ